MENYKTKIVMEDVYCIPFIKEQRKEDSFVLKYETNEIENNKKLRLIKDKGVFDNG